MKVHRQTFVKKDYKSGAEEPVLGLKYSPRKHEEKLSRHACDSSQRHNVGISIAVRLGTLAMLVNFRFV